MKSAKRRKFVASHNDGDICLFVKPTGFGIARSLAGVAGPLTVTACTEKGPCRRINVENCGAAAAKAKAVRHFNSASSAVARHFPRSRNFDYQLGENRRLGIPYDFSRNSTRY